MMLISGSEATWLIQGDTESLWKRRNWRNPLDPVRAPCLITTAVCSPCLCEAGKDLVISEFDEFGGDLQPAGCKHQL